MVSTILDNLKICLAQQQQQSSEKLELEGNDEKVSSQEGFRKQDKILIIVRALVTSDIAVCGICQFPTSVIGMKVLDIFEKNGCVSDYRSTRAEIASILGCLTQVKDNKISDNSSGCFPPFSKRSISWSSVVSTIS
jgi:aerobic-type carbon monoxide dehydrogenase small subunit (CoxS/CutS family)